jgi:hypothetical protein
LPREQEAEPPADVRCHVTVKLPVPPASELVLISE